MGLEGIFGGEKYSKETYQYAENDKKVYEDRLKMNLPADIRDVESHGAEEAKKRVEKLFGKSNAEAEKMNEEYDRLLARAQEAIKAVKDFEKEKLGMSGGE